MAPTSRSDRCPPHSVCWASCSCRWCSSRKLLSASQPALPLLQYLLPLVLMYALNFGTSTLVAKALFARGAAISLVCGAVTRNLSTLLAIAIGIFGKKGSTARW